MNIQTAEEFLKEKNFTNSIEGHSSGNKTTSQMMIEFAKIHVKAALEEVKKTQFLKYTAGETGYLKKEDFELLYPLENIK